MVLMLVDSLHYWFFESIPEARSLDLEFKNTARFAKSLSLLTENVLDKLVDAMDSLRRALDGKGDGPISRNQLAKLLNIDKGTLKNNADWLPRPIERGRNNVPIYQYSQALKSLEDKRPDIAIMLPSYEEALHKLSELSST